MELKKQFKISLTTCNVLYEPYYKRWIKDRQFLMPFEKRIQAFELNKNFFNSNDIVCFQEFPYSKDNKNEQSKNSFKKKAKEIFPKNEFKHIKDPQAKSDGLYSVIKSSTFDLIKSEIITFEKSDDIYVGTKRIQFLSLCLHEKPECTFGIINTHLPFVKHWFQSSEENSRKLFHQLLDIKSKNNDIQNWIVCGDFNFNILGKLKSRYSLLIEESCFDPKKGWKNIVSDFGFSEKSTSVNHELEMNDYILWNSQFLFASSVTQIPEDLEHLVKHFNKTENPWFYDDYFSDHSAVKIEFDFQN
ncbi:carbon catabolite repressor protein [Anaeramoeba ignava]|uniref:Carbon catabolite repressor protein n=1 Tax=Anaeramoeba ignava TaxID=1746090 RepID=A0A9Q0L806_ANAIG|nr:carbon catabolite repressor protein [Anaeramoeba ignava]